MAKVGRPKSKDGGKAPYTFRLDLKTAERVAELAKRTTLDRSTLLRLLIEKALRHFEKDGLLVQTEEEIRGELMSWQRRRNDRNT